MTRKINKKGINFRYNLITVVTYVIGVILIVQLFNLQIVHGTEYRQQSNTRLTRESVIEAARGDILDRSGNVLVTSGQKFNLELYKSKIDTDTLNDSILKIINVLEENDTNYHTFFSNVTDISYGSNEKEIVIKNNDGIIYYSVAGFIEKYK